MLILGSVIQIYFLSFTLENIAESRAENALRDHVAMLRANLDEYGEFLLGQAIAAAEIPLLQQGLSSGDRRMLLGFAKKYADRLLVGLSLDSLAFHFYDAEGRELIDTGSLKGKGENWSGGHLLIRALQSGIPVYGLAEVEGDLHLMAFTPAEAQGELAGAVGVDIELAEILERMTLHQSSMAFLRQQAVEKEKIEGRLIPDWPAVTGWGETWEESVAAWRESGMKNAAGWLRYRLHILRDDNGAVLGGVLFSFDTMHLHEARLNRVYQLGGLFVSGAVLLWAILFLNVRRVERFLQRLKKIIVASHSSDFTERFESDHVHCLEVLHCHNEECPVYVDPSRVCYLETGSEAISPAWRDTCIFLNMYETCQNCPVYMLRRGDELAEMRNVVNTMMRHWSTFLTRAGHLMSYVMRSQEPQSLTISLDEVSTRLEHMAKLAFFTHDIQGTLDKDEVYAQLDDVFKKMFNLTTFVLFEVDHEADRIAIALDGNKDEPLCKREVLLSTEICRAKRLAEDVFSYYNPSLCPHFHCDTNDFVRCCLPMVMGGHVGAVFSFLAPKNRWEQLRGEVVPLLRKHLDAAAPVLSSLRLLRLSKEQALRDALTHCHNRRFLDEFITKYEPLSQREGRCTGFLMADLDYFKQVNDKYGHEAGDLVLKAVVGCISATIRRSDLLIRYGGEEFLILLQEVKDNMSEQIAEKIRANVEQLPLNLGAGTTIRKTISIGVAEYPKDAASVYKVIKFSDVALYEAKNRGRNRVVRFKPEMWQEEQY